MGGCWATPPPGLVLGPTEIHVWRAHLDVPPDGVRSLEPMLAPAERERAAQFRHPADRARFIVAHSALRTILAGYLSVDSQAIPLTADARGKPRLATRDGLCFNLSHSADLALCALARHCEVGVDLERVPSEFPVEATAQQFFAPHESAALLALPVDTRPRAFFDLWVRKEAYRKACGEGLALPLNASEAPGWTLLGLEVGDGYAGALAHAGPARQLACWHWPGV